LLLTTTPEVSSVYSSGQSVATAAVQVALDEVCRVYEGHAITTKPDGGGGAFVVVCDLALSECFVQDSTWLGFQISYLYPASDVYPHYVRHDLTRRDAQPLGIGFSPTVWGYDDRQAVQVSRRSNKWDPRLDTAALKAVKVMAWVNQS
jgi:hypothetical protein